MGEDPKIIIIMMMMRARVRVRVRARVRVVRVCVHFGIAYGTIMVP